MFLEKKNVNLTKTETLIGVLLLTYRDHNNTLVKNNVLMMNFEKKNNMQPRK